MHGHCQRFVDEAPIAKVSFSDMTVCLCNGLPLNSKCQVANNLKFDCDA